MSLNLTSNGSFQVMCFLDEPHGQETFKFFDSRRILFLTKTPLLLLNLLSSWFYAQGMFYQFGISVRNVFVAPANVSLCLIRSHFSCCLILSSILVPILIVASCLFWSRVISFGGSFISPYFGSCSFLAFTHCSMSLEGGGCKTSPVFLFFSSTCLFLHF